MKLCVREKKLFVLKILARNTQEFAFQRVSWTMTLFMPDVFLLVCYFALNPTATGGILHPS